MWLPLEQSHPNDRPHQIMEPIASPSQPIATVSKRSRLRSIIGLGSKPIFVRSNSSQLVPVPSPAAAVSPSTSLTTLKAPPPSPRARFLPNPVMNPTPHTPTLGRRKSALKIGASPGSAAGFNTPLCTPPPSSSLFLSPPPAGSDATRASTTSKRERTRTLSATATSARPCFQWVEGDADAQDGQALLGAGLLAQGRRLSVAFSPTQSSQGTRSRALSMSAASHHSTSVYNAWDQPALPSLISEEAWEESMSAQSTGCHPASEELVDDHDSSVQAIENMDPLVGLGLALGETDQSFPQAVEIPQRCSVLQPGRQWAIRSTPSLVSTGGSSSGRWSPTSKDLPQTPISTPPLRSQIGLQKGTCEIPSETRIFDDLRSDPHSAALDGAMDLGSSASAGHFSQIRREGSQRRFSVKPFMLQPGSASFLKSLTPDDVDFSEAAMQTVTKARGSIHHQLESVTQSEKPSIITGPIHAQPQSALIEILDKPAKKGDSSTMATSKSLAPPRPPRNANRLSAARVSRLTLPVGATLKAQRAISSQDANFKISDPVTTASSPAKAFAGLLARSDSVTSIDESLMRASTTSKTSLHKSSSSRSSWRRSVRASVLLDLDNTARRRSRRSSKCPSPRSLLTGSHQHSVNSISEGNVSSGGGSDEFESADEGEEDFWLIKRNSTSTTPSKLPKTPERQQSPRREEDCRRNCDSTRLSTPVSHDVQQALARLCGNELPNLRLRPAHDRQSLAIKPTHSPDSVKELVRESFRLKGLSPDSRKRSILQAESADQLGFVDILSRRQRGENRWSGRPLESCVSASPQKSWPLHSRPFSLQGKSTIQYRRVTASPMLAHSEISTLAAQRSQMGLDVQVKYPSDFDGYEAQNHYGPTAATTIRSSTAASVSSEPASTWQSSLLTFEYSSLLARHGSLELRRQEVIWELYETEVAFVTGMRGVIATFASPLRTPAGEWIRGVPVSVSRLFDWLEDIVNLHSDLVACLDKPRQVQEDGDVVIHFAHYILPFVEKLEVHQPYLVRFELVAAAIEVMTADFENDYGEFVRMQTALPECQNMTLTSFLLKPVQRLMKYPLFFRQLKDLTPLEHPDHLSTASVLHSVDSLIRVMQEVKSREDEYEKLRTLQSHIRGLPPHTRIAQRDRYLLAHGLLKRLHVSPKDKMDINLEDATNRRRSGFQSQTSDYSASEALSPQLGKIERPFSQVSVASYGSASTWESSGSSRDYEKMTPCTTPALRDTLPVLEFGGDVFDDPNITFDRINMPEDCRTPSPKFARPSSGAWGETVKPRQRTLSASRLLRRSKESPLHVFVFNDIVLLATGHSDGVRLIPSAKVNSKKNNQQTYYRLIEGIGLSRVVGVTDLSDRTDCERLLRVNVLPWLQSAHGDEISVGGNPSTLYLSVPARLAGTRHPTSQEVLDKEHQRWLMAFEQSSQSSDKAVALGKPLESSLECSNRPRSPSESARENGCLADQEREERIWWRARHHAVKQDMDTADTTTHSRERRRRSSMTSQMSRHHDARRGRTVSLGLHTTRISINMEHHL